MVGGILRHIDEAVVLKQLQAVVAARADGSLAGQPFQCRAGLQQMIAFQVRLFRNAVFPHVIRHLVPAAGDGSNRLRIQFAYPPGGEHGRLDAVRVEQLDQPPDPDPSTKLPLGQLLRGFVHQAAQQHGVEVRREVHRDPDARRIGHAGDP